MNKATFTATITKENKDGGWTFIPWPDSVAFLGGGKAAKVVASIAGHEFAVTCLPTGDGTHFLPLNKAVMKAIKSAIGDEVVVEIWKPN